MVSFQFYLRAAKCPRRRPARRPSVSRLLGEHKSHCLFVASLLPRSGFQFVQLRPDLSCLRAQPHQVHDEYGLMVLIHRE